ncbi:hypothetical protein ACIGHB_29845 [Streptomyces sp. NPDC085460]|uniref:hypothetical protein n=1 Tax=Streptomyces sp. NPDC085460 TaxID=3365723 RepID=UPI0037D7CBCB
MTVPAPGNPDFSDDLPVFYETSGRWLRGTAVSAPASLDLVNGLSRRLTLLERDYKLLHKEHERLQTRVAELESHLAPAAPPCPQQPRQGNNVHHLIAREFVVLVEQRVQSLARAASRNPSQDSPEELHHRIGAVCRALFGQDAPRTETVLAALHRSPLDRLAPTAARLCERGLELRHQAETSGLPTAWDFEFATGTPLDDTWQEPWLGCVNHLPGLFVVAPAYLVAEQVYVRQRLHTGHRRL